MTKFRNMTHPLYLSVSIAFKGTNIICFYYRFNSPSHNINGEVSMINTKVST